MIKQAWIYYPLTRFTGFTKIAWNLVFKNLQLATNLTQKVLVIFLQQQVPIPVFEDSKRVKSSSLYGGGGNTDVGK